MDAETIYLNEAEHQIQYAKICFANYKTAAAVKDIPQMFFHVHHFVVHIANIDKLLDPKSSNPRRNILQDSIDLRTLDLKQFRRLRNHLEHFDERLDDWVKNYSGHAFFDMNLVTGTKGFPDRAFLRALDGSIFKFHGDSYDLDALYQQLLDIEKQIVMSLERLTQIRNRREK